MDAVTYPDEKVITFVQESYIPLLIPYNAEPLSKDFNIKWTPTLITLGTDQREHHRTVGFLDPDSFIANSLLGIGKYHFDNDRFQEAETLFREIISNYPRGDCTAEAIFLHGVSQYKQTGKAHYLKEAYETLKSQYPESEWTRRASPYRLL